MIGWLKGEKIAVWGKGLKQGIVLACQGVGYEVQLLPRHLPQIEDSENLVLWIHQVKREDVENLYGFPNQSERDLFRLLIGINGLGPQMGISLLETIETKELIQAIQDRDIVKLCQAQGIGKKLAERLTIELHDKLIASNTRESALITSSLRDLTTDDCYTKESEFEDLFQTLKVLGYQDHEITQAWDSASKTIETIHSKNKPDIKLGEGDSEALLKACLVWLSEKDA